jgi:TPR repeat protein
MENRPDCPFGNSHTLHTMSIRNLSLYIDLKIWFLLFTFLAFALPPKTFAANNLETYDELQSTTAFVLFTPEPGVSARLKTYSSVNPKRGFFQPFIQSDGQFFEIHEDFIIEIVKMEELLPKRLDPNDAPKIDASLKRVEAWNKKFPNLADKWTRLSTYLTEAKRKLNGGQVRRNGKWLQANDSAAKEQKEIEQVEKWEPLTLTNGQTYPKARLQTNKDGKITVNANGKCTLVTPNSLIAIDADLLPKEKSNLAFLSQDSSMESEQVGIIRMRAIKGELDAQKQIARMYDLGEGVERNALEARKWYSKAANKGDAESCCWLAIMYRNGLGVEKNSKEAFNWFNKAANLDHAFAQYMLADMYLRGEGVELNNAEWLKWLRKAADQGYDSAQYDLGVTYENGTVVERDLDQAAKWYRLAAAQGRADAKGKLASMPYQYSNSPHQSKDEAIKEVMDYLQSENFNITTSELLVFNATNKWEDTESFGYSGFRYNKQEQSLEYKATRIWATNSTDIDEFGVNVTTLILYKIYLSTASHEITIETKSDRQPEYQVLSFKCESQNKTLKKRGKGSNHLLKGLSALPTDEEINQFNKSSYGEKQHSNITFVVSPKVASGLKSSLEKLFQTN